ncbi:BQ5605_C003g02294 [Microbotryum silenes-dioicae]|uniref:DNA replication complex GINS protein PSF2 n=1 Tax=Microbotryum silenes-dioicae TaxID=796604 RepID=A0A2X0M4R8_9BASI|nr:BQ5605_C003g02294 [Microbotryum silenes-dioicae]
MSVSRLRQLGPTPGDLEFLAMERTIEIVPSVKVPLVEGLDGPSIRYGPLNPPQKSTVPLWFAVHLKKKRKCRIIAPTWLAIPRLENTLQEETTDEGFSDLPRDYLEVSKILLEVQVLHSKLFQMGLIRIERVRFVVNHNSASDDIAQPDKVRLLLKDIREARQAKVRAGLAALNPIHLAMPNLASLEVNELRPFFALAHKRMSMLDPEAERHEEIEQLWLEKPNEAARRAELGEYEYEAGGGAARSDRDGTEFNGAG